MTKYDIAANVELAGLDGFSGRLTAAQQKQLFGRNVFGKKEVSIDASNQGRVSGRFSVCFGTDSVDFDFSFDHIASLSNNPGRPVYF